MKPELFNNEARSSDIVFDGRNSCYLTKGDHDLNGYLASDVPEGANITANHSHIYIDGKVKARGRVSARQGIISVSSLEEDAEVAGGLLLIISSEQLSRRSKNFHSPSNDHPTILVVPEDKRAEVFDALVEKTRHYPHFPPVHELKEFIQEHPEIPIKIISANWEHSAALRDANIPFLEREIGI